MQIEFRQHDWIPGFAAFEAGSTEPGPAFCVLNLGSILCGVATGDTPKEDVPYIVAESMMHEIIHAIEEWAGVEFNCERIEGLLTKYGQAAKAAEGK